MWTVWVRLTALVWHCLTHFFPNYCFLFFCAGRAEICSRTLGPGKSGPFHPRQSVHPRLVHGLHWVVFPSNTPQGRGRVHISLYSCVYTCVNNYLLLVVATKFQMIVFFSQTKVLILTNAELALNNAFGNAEWVWLDHTQGWCCTLVEIHIVEIDTELCLGFCK